MTIEVLLIIRVRIPSTLAWCLDGRFCHRLVQPLHWLLDGVEVQKNRNPVKIWLISMGEYDNCSITYNMKSNFTFVSGFHRLQPDVWMDDLVTTLSSLYFASRRIEIQSKFGLFQWANMTIGLQHGLEDQKNRNPVKRIEIQLKFGLFQWANMTIGLQHGLEDQKNRNPVKRIEIQSKFGLF